MAVARAKGVGDLNKTPLRPPIVKVEKACSSRGASAAMGGKGLLQEAGAVSLRLPTEQGYLALAIEPRHQATRFQVGVGGTGTLRPAARLMPHFSNSSACRNQVGCG